MRSRPIFCYLIHFDQPYRHARHYVGCTANVPARLKRHRGNRGANLLRVLNEAGIGYRAVRVWLRGVEREQTMKKVGHHRRYCPVCKREERQ